MQEMLNNLVNEINNTTPQDWYNAAMFYIDWPISVFQRMNINIF